ncbi:unnamed protein product [Mytilus coruscus]|uniref:SWIM-type domain-containing protein n=1 Tax=Mytilus coruscus TaxID=42192 RepID=A0A6J8CN28_MYTCO|nr:unnamed protein product [Mytilus coruscus]
MGDGKNNDANILTHIIKRNIEKITDWLQEDDILIVDRGFRDSLDQIDSTDFDIEFPRLNEEELRNLTLGNISMKMAKSYTEEHFDSEGYEISFYKIQSRHISSKCYQLWISFNECVVLGWYCKCKIGSRVVGMCSHIASVIWYLGFGRYTDKQFRINNWGQYLLDAKNIPEPEEIDASDDEATVTEE